MQILEVIPITKGAWLSSLSYFTKEPVLPGAIINVTIRAKTVPALVIKSRPATEVRTALRQADFQIKKAGDVSQPDLFLPGFLKAAEKTALHFGSPLGPVLSSLIPKSLLDFKQPLNQPKFKSTDSGLKIEHGVLQGPDEERYSFYKSLIRESFARGHSVFFCLPTIIDIETARPILEKGIEDFTLAIHSQLTKKDLIHKFKQIKTTHHPLVIIGTPTFLSLVRADIKTIILEKENSAAYKELRRPFIDYRVFAHSLGEAIGAKVIIGDLALRTETIFKVEKGELAPLAPIKYRAFTELNQKLIDATANRVDEATWQPISSQFVNQLSEALAFGDRVFILTGRRGLAPTTICQDCGLVKSCQTCGGTLVLHDGLRPATSFNPESRHRQPVFFQCHRCGQMEAVSDRCRRCGGWRLQVLGLGIETIEKTLKQKLPGQIIERIDSDRYQTKKAVQTAINKFYRQPGSILLGTELALNYLRELVETTAVIGLDSLLSVPDFRINEKLFLLLLQTRRLATKRFFMETRKPEEKTYLYALAGNLLDFYRDEISERKKLGWPPFSLLIKLTAEGWPETVAKLMQGVATDLAAYEPIPLSLPGLKPRTRRELLIIQRPAADWPDKNLAQLLCSLPPLVTVDVEPENLF